METVMEYLRAVSAETAEAARFRLEAGECAVVDNFLLAHGREAYSNLERAMWQVWAWTNESLAVPPTAGPNREWMKHPGHDGLARGKEGAVTCVVSSLVPHRCAYAVELFGILRVLHV